MNYCIADAGIYYIGSNMTCRTMCLYTNKELNLTYNATSIKCVSDCGTTWILANISNNFTCMDPTLPIFRYFMTTEKFTTITGAILPIYTQQNVSVTCSGILVTNTIC
jgi:hypothetical protein